MPTASDIARSISRRRVTAWVRKRVLRKDVRSPNPSVSSRAIHLVHEIAESARRNARRDVSRLHGEQPSFDLNVLRGWLRKNYPADLRAYKSFRKEVFRQLPAIRNDEYVDRFVSRVRSIAENYFHPKVVLNFTEIFLHEMHVRKYQENGFFFLDRTEAVRYLEKYPHAIEDAFDSLNISAGERSHVWKSVKGKVADQLVDYNPLKSMLPGFITGVIKQEYWRMRRS